MGSWKCRPMRALDEHPGACLSVPGRYIALDVHKHCPWARVEAVDGRLGACLGNGFDKG